MEFDSLRDTYKRFIYKDYEILDDANKIIIKYFFEIEGLTTFEPTIEILKKNFNIREINTKFVKNLVFNLGMIEAISYFKATCSPQFIIECGYLDKEQIKWFQKIYYLGLGEFRYINNIKISQEEFVNFISKKLPKKIGNSKETEDLKKLGIVQELKNLNQVKSLQELGIAQKIKNIEEVEDLQELESSNEIEKNKQQLDGIIIPIGGGKDSNVTLDLLKKYKSKSLCFRVGVNDVVLKSASVAGYSRDELIEVKRTIDKNLLDLNGKGFLNGHTPFSAMIAFLTNLVAYLLGKKYVALSNEESASESNVEGEKINHQYSKSLEFENDFRWYVENYLKTGVEYFSMLRPISELQIAMLFSKLEGFHKVFKSCNVGSKVEPWKWCCSCPKCLFVYTMLSPFLCKEKLVDIFGEDLFDKKDLLQTFIELCGYGKIKPFECVGTYEEIKYAITKTIENIEKIDGELPFLLKYYDDNFEKSNAKLLEYYNENNNLPEEFEKILKGKILL